jgi:hypothetical protein
MWNIVAWKHYETYCNMCSVRILADDARYHCKDCKYSVCTECSSDLLGRKTNSQTSAIFQNHFFSPPTAAEGRTTPGGQSLGIGPGKVQPGDLFLCGPDRWGIHHVILSIGQMQPDPQMQMFLANTVPELDLQGMDIFTCETIESTRSLKGREIVWYRAKNFFARDRATGESLMVGDIGKDQGELELHYEPVRVKMLMHPLRQGHGGPAFNPQAFQQALEISAYVSKHWSLTTAVKGLLSRQRAKSLNPEGFTTRETRVALLEDLERRWEVRPICASVAIMVWQRYFKIACGPGPEGEDQAVKYILRYMPLFSDKTLPSALIKELSKCGWVLRGNLDA